jgi:hypothetical protein
MVMAQIVVVMPATVQTKTTFLTTTGSNQKRRALLDNTQTTSHKKVWNNKTRKVNTLGTGRRKVLDKAQMHQSWLHGDRSIKNQMLRGRRTLRLN